MTSIFAVICSAMPELRSIKFFESKEGARNYLKELANERRFKLGIQCFEEHQDIFQYLFGFEEHRVKYSVVELPVEP